MAPPNPLPAWYEDAQVALSLFRRTQNFLSLAVYDGCPAKEILSEINKQLDKLTVIVLKGKTNAR